MLAERHLNFIPLLLSSRIYKPLMSATVLSYNTRTT